MLHTVRMGFLIHPLNFCSAELSAMRLDGDITPEGMFLDVPEGWVSRVVKTLWGYSCTAVLTGISATWALGATSEPDIHTVTSLPGHPHGISPRMNFRIEERTLEQEDVWSVGNFGVTTPLRTLSDLLRNPHVSTTVRTELAQNLMREHHISQTMIRTYIGDRKFVPYSRVARQLLNELRGN